MTPEPKLSKLQRWILTTAYNEITKSGSTQPTVREKSDPRWGHKDRRSHLLSIEVLRDYFNMPVREQRGASGHWLVIDGAAGRRIYPWMDGQPADPKEANAARSSLSRALRRLEQRGLIDQRGEITLTPRGIEVAKELG
jgi:hypothetical protein